MKKDVIILTGAGQIGMAIARRMGYGKKIVIGDKKTENAGAIAGIMNGAGFDAVPVETDLSSRESVLNLIAKAQEYGEISMLINSAGVSPSQAPVEAILKVDLYGTAVLLEEVGKVIGNGGVGVTISSQSGHRMPALTPEEDRLLATTPAEELTLVGYPATGTYPGHAARLPDGQTLQRETSNGGSGEMGRAWRTHQLHLARHRRNTVGA